MIRIEPYSNLWRRLARRTSGGALAVAAWLLLPVAGARADVPSWMQAAATQPLPAYPADTDAVLLLDEQVTTVKDSGEIDTVYRRVFKILRTEGKRFGTVSVYFDSETRLTYLKGWAIAGDGERYEVKEKEAIETSPFADFLYQDTRLKLLVIPAANPGNVIGYEYQQRRRPYVLEDSWAFQREIPTRSSRFSLHVPGSWEIKPYWINREPIDGHTNRPQEWSWRIENVPAIPDEPAMPPWESLAGRMLVSFFPTGGGRRGMVFKS